jgi:hypothetical protein
MKHLTLISAFVALGVTNVSFSQRPSPGASASSSTDVQTLQKQAPVKPQAGPPPLLKEPVAPAGTQSRAKQSAQPPQSTQEVRPDAVYAKPSGQDSRPQPSNVITDRQAPTSKHSDQPSAPVSGTQTTYRGNTGKKPAVGTACSTARVKPNGDLDCGTGGAAALPGKIPK